MAKDVVLLSPMMDRNSCEDVALTSMKNSSFIDVDIQRMRTIVFLQKPEAVVVFLEDILAMYVGHSPAFPN